MTLLIPNVCYAIYWIMCEPYTTSYIHLNVLESHSVSGVLDILLYTQVPIYVYVFVMESIVTFTVSNPHKITDAHFRQVNCNVLRFYLFCFLLPLLTCLFITLCVVVYKCLCIQMDNVVLNCSHSALLHCVHKIIVCFVSFIPQR